MSENNINSKKTKKKMPLFLKIIIGLLILILILVGSGFGAFYYFVNQVETVEIDKTNLGVTSNEELSVQYEDPEQITNIALFGIDTVDGMTGRSDAIMIATIDPIHNKLKLTSVMRDSYVHISGYGKDKINHAYAFGGAELAINTLNQNFGLNIENFVTVDFSSLPLIIDALGGVELNITNEEIPHINNYVNNINKLDGTSSPHIYSAGVQRVNGVQALAYSRIRYTSGGDYKRTERQRDVLEGLFDRILSLPASQYPTLVTDLLPLVKTNLTAGEILSLGTEVLSLGTTELIQERFPRDGDSWGDTINSVYYLVFNEENVRQQMMDYIFDDK